MDGFFCSSRGSFELVVILALGAANRDCHTCCVPKDRPINQRPEGIPYLHTGAFMKLLFIRPILVGLLCLRAQFNTVTRTVQVWPYYAYIALA